MSAVRWLPLVLLALSACGEPGERPSSPAERASLAEARALLEHGLPEHVHARLASLLAQEPVPVEADYLAGQAAYELGNWGEAVARLQAVVTRDAPGYLTRCNSLGFAHYKLGDFDAARRVFEAILAVDPGETKARYGLGQLAVSLAAWAEARGHLEQVLAAQPDHFKARYALARVLEAEGDAEGALREVSRVLEQVPSHDEALYLLAGVLARLGRAQEAEEALARRAHVDAVREGIGALQQRLRSGEDSPLLRLEIVTAFLSLGDRGEAAAALRAARARFPDDPALRSAAERFAPP